MSIFASEDAFSDIDAFVWMLHGGAILLGFAAVLCSGAITAGTQGQGFWEAALKYSPMWMRKMVGFFVLYGIVNFIWFLCSGVEDTGTGTPAAVFRGFSGHWMIFYSIEVGIFYSFLHSDKYTKFQNSNEKKRIMNRLWKGGIFAVLFILFSATCFVTGNPLLFVFVCISVWFMGFAAFLIAVSVGIVHAVYFRKHHPGLLTKSIFGPHKQRVEYTYRIKQIKEPGLEKIKAVYKKITWTLFYLWVFGIVPTICVLYFLYVPKGLNH